LLRCYLFGMLTPGRHANSADYRYGFNGMELDNEVKGEGNSYDFGARMYDPRVGRFLSLDPKWREFESSSHYNYAANNPIFFIDSHGENPLPCYLHDHFTMTCPVNGNVLKMNSLLISS